MDRSTTLHKQDLLSNEQLEHLKSQVCKRVRPPRESKGIRAQIDSENISLRERSFQNVRTVLVLKRKVLMQS